MRKLITRSIAAVSVMSLLLSPLSAFAADTTYTSYGNATVPLSFGGSTDINLTYDLNGWYTDADLTTSSSGTPNRLANSCGYVCEKPYKFAEHSSSDGGGKTYYPYPMTALTWPDFKIVNAQYAKSDVNGSPTFEILPMTPNNGVTALNGNNYYVEGGFTTEKHPINDVFFGDAVDSQSEIESTLGGFGAFGGNTSQMSTLPTYVSEMSELYAKDTPNPLFFALKREITIDKSTTLYAQYYNEVQYVSNYVPQKGCMSVDNDVYIVNNEDYSYTIKPYSNEKGFDNGSIGVVDSDGDYCIFTGWNTKADGTGTSYKSGQTVSAAPGTYFATTIPDNNTGKEINGVLYAQWRKSPHKGHIVVPLTANTSTSTSTSTETVTTSTSTTTSTSKPPVNPPTDPETPPSDPETPPTKPSPSSTQITPDPIAPENETSTNTEAYTPHQKSNVKPNPIKPKKDNKVFKKILNLLTAIAIGAVTAVGLWFLIPALLFFLFAKKDKKWHSVLTTDDNTYIKIEADDNDDSVLQDLINVAADSEQTLEFAKGTKSITRLPWKTKADITYETEDGFKSETVDADEDVVYDELNKLHRNAEVTIYNGLARFRFTLHFKFTDRDED